MRLKVRVIVYEDKIYWWVVGQAACITRAAWSASHNEPELSV